MNLEYKPFDFVTPDCTPEIRGRRVVLFSLSLDFYAFYPIHVHIMFS